jgi:hypothetical protein
MVAAWAHHSDTRRSRQRRPALPALAVAALLAAALTGCTLGREPQARSAPAPVLAPSAQAATGDIPEVVRTSRRRWSPSPTTRGPAAG